MERRLQEPHETFVMTAVRDGQTSRQLMKAPRVIGLARLTMKYKKEKIKARTNKPAISVSVFRSTPVTTVRPSANNRSSDRRDTRGRGRLFWMRLRLRRRAEDAAGGCR